MPVTRTRMAAQHARGLHSRHYEESLMHRSLLRQRTIGYGVPRAAYDRDSKRSTPNAQRSTSNEEIPEEHRFCGE